MSRQYLLKGASLAEIQRRATAEYGPAARLVSAEKITTGGLGRFLAKHHYEAVVEAPESAQPSPTPSVDLAEEHRGLTLAALLEAADQAELKESGAQPSPAVVAPIRRERRTRAKSPTDFARVLDSQAFALDPASGRRAAEVGEYLDESQVARAVMDVVPKHGTPEMLHAEGDLIVVVGPHTEPLLASDRLSERGYLRRNAGRHTQELAAVPVARRPINERRDALRARATAVEQGTAVLVALALGMPRDRAKQLELLTILDPDQIWAVVDATRKPADTADWVQQLAQAHSLDGVLCLNAMHTSTPHTVHELGLPVLELNG